MIKAIVVPTPKKIKKYIGNFDFKQIKRLVITKERIVLYGIIGTGIIIIAFNKLPYKVFVIGSLIYNGIAYEVLEKWYKDYGDDEIIKSMSDTSLYLNNFYRIR